MNERVLGFAISFARRFNDNLKKKTFMTTKLVTLGCTDELKQDTVAVRAL